MRLKGVMLFRLKLVNFPRQKKKKILIKEKNEQDDSVVEAYEIL